MSKGATLEMQLNIFNDDTGERIEVREDTDGLGMIDIRYADEKGKCHSDVRMTLDQAEKMIEALPVILAFMRGKYAKCEL